MRRAPELIIKNTSTFFLTNDYECVLTTNYSCIFAGVTTYIPPSVKVTIGQTGLWATENRKHETLYVNEEDFVNLMRLSDAYMHQ